MAAAILLALRTRPLAPPLLATVQAPCPASHPHILFPWRVTPRPGVGLQLETRSHPFGPRGGAVDQAGDRSRAVPGPDVRSGRGELGTGAGLPGPDVLSGRGELGTGAGLSETYLSTQSHRCPEEQTHARGPRTHSARHSDLMPRPPHTWKRLQLPRPCGISPKCVRLVLPGRCEAGFSDPAAGLGPALFFHPLQSPQPSSRERIGVHRLRGAQGWVQRVLPRAPITQPGDGGRAQWKERKSFPPRGGGFPRCGGPQRHRPLSRCRAS